MNRPVAVLGCTGFVGRALVERWPAADRDRIRLIIHRSRPHWIATSGGSPVDVDFQDEEQIINALADAHTLVNLLRPDGSGWLGEIISRIVKVLPRTAIKRVVHISSIDVYGVTPSTIVSEETAPEPLTPYEKEHLAVERQIELCGLDIAILRLGAVFGVGGRNVVELAKETRDGPLWKLAVRRALYGKRRMQLVSVENVADAIRHIAQRTSEFRDTRILVTDDDAPENNFADVQETLLTAFGRPSLISTPELPRFCLRVAQRLAGKRDKDPMRRFSGSRLRDLGFNPPMPFIQRLEDYAAKLKVGGTDTSL